MSHKAGGTTHQYRFVAIAVAAVIVFSAIYAIRRDTGNGIQQN